MVISQIYHHLLNLFFPKQCLLCKNHILEDLLLCFPCLAEQKRPASLTIRSGSNLVLKIYALFPYQGAFKSIVLSKFVFDQSLLVSTANTSPLLLEDLQNKDFFEKSVLVPIPIHWWRRFRRGFNQTEVFANAISKKLKLPSLNILQRVKNTAFQSKLSPAGRKLNLKDAFTAKQELANSIKNKHVIIIDDLCTTGATLLAAAKILKKSGADKISALVICR